MTQSLAQRLAERLDRRPLRAQRPPHPDRPAPAFARAHASPFGHRLSEDKIVRQQVEGPLEPRVITRPKAHHGLAEHAPGRERRVPRHALHQVARPPPVSSVHGAETALDCFGVPAQGMARLVTLKTVPAPAEHEQVRQRPFGRGCAGPDGQVIRVDRQRVGSVQIAHVPRQILFRQRRGGDGCPVPGRLRAHGGGLPVQSAPCQLPGALDARAEAKERQLHRTGVSGLRLPEPVERAAPVPSGEESAHLLRQIAGGCVRRRLAFPLSTAVLARCHAEFACGPFTQPNS